MSAYVVRAIVLITWVGSLLAAFQFGKGMPKPVLSGESTERNPRKAVTFEPGGNSAANSSSSAVAADSGAASVEGGMENGGGQAVVDVQELVASMKARMGGAGGMMYNSTAMMRIMAPVADLTEDQIYEALEEVDNTVSAQQQKMMFSQMLLGRLAEIDGERAMDYIAEKFEGRGGMAASLTMSVIGAWAQRDPDATWDWFVEHRDDISSGGMSDSKVMYIFSGWAAQNLENAFRRLDELDDFDKNMAVSGIAMGAAWNPDLRDELLSHARELPSDQKSRIYQRMFSQWAMSTPQEALEWARRLPDEDRKKIARQGGYSLMYSSPELGAEFMLENASEEELPQTYSRIAGQWANRDPNAAGEWLNELPQGPHLDDARSSFARTISRRDPISAMAWAKAVETDKKRTLAVRQVYSQWYRKDPQAADSALDSSGISEEEIGSIRNTVSNAKPLQQRVFIR